MSKWVCVTKDWRNFKYGKIYEGKQERSLLDVENDIGERTMPCLCGVEFDKKTKLYKSVYYFIKLEEWRERQINQIL